MNVRRHRRLGHPGVLPRGALCAVVATAALLAPATSASAAPARPYISCLPYPSSGTMASGPAAQYPSAGTFDMTPTGHYWSVVAARGSQLGNVDIALHDSPANLCNEYTRSDDANAGHADWIAFDNNSGRLPVTTYGARFYTSPGSDYYQFVAGNAVLSTTQPTLDQPMGLGGTTAWIADVHDVWLVDASTYTFTVTGGFSAVYLLRSSSAEPDTWTRTKTTANPSVVLPDSDPSAPPGGVLDMVRTGTLTFHPQTSKWFGLLVVRNGWWGKAVSVRVSVS
jgi:hypothetical protein